MVVAAFGDEVGLGDEPVVGHHPLGALQCGLPDHRAGDPNRHHALMSTLREALLGGWELSSFDSVDADTGAVSHPLGTTPRGLILYTADGYMSAQLTGSPDATVPDKKSPGYIAYGGRFRVDEDTATVHHDVSVSMLPELLARPQPRQARVDGDRLNLSATTTTDGVTTLNTLVWVRPR